MQFWAVAGQRGSRGAGAEPGTNFASSEPWGREGARLWWVWECRRWQREVADVGHLFYKFGSKEGRKEVAQAAGSRKRLLGFSFCKWQDGDFFPPKTDGHLNVSEETTNDGKVLKLVSQTPKHPEWKKSLDCAAPSSAPVC